MIFLVDASVYVFRAYHSVLPDMVDRDGNPVHAVFGFARFIGDLIERIRPRYMAVAFDQRRASGGPVGPIRALPAGVPAPGFGGVHQP
jgi:5'-3' exonuclease